MYKSYLLVGAGGAIGSMLRYGCGTIVQHKIFPISTLLVNILGCFLMGLMMGLSLKNEYRLLLATGLCGGFTTFSAFTFENLQLIYQQKFFVAMTYTGGSLLLCMLAVWFGFKLTSA